jgi:hypothetical protein
MQVQQLKQIIAEAMYAGCLLAEQNYSDEIHSETHEPLVNAFRKLQKLVGEFGS